MKNKYTCDVTFINKTAVLQTKSKMPKDGVILKASDIFRGLGDFTRVKILFALSHRELCVCDIAYLLSMSQSAVSHQLRVLRSARFVNFRKEGKIVYYSLADKHILELLNSGVKHARE